MGVLRTVIQNRGWWGLELFIAAIAVLALIQLHGNIVRSALNQIGLGVEEPTLLLARDSCGHQRWLPPALSDLEEQSTDAAVQDCAHRLDLWVVRKQGADLVLFVNGSFERLHSGRNRLSTFRTIRLREGGNRITVLNAEDKLLYPFPWKDQREVIDLLTDVDYATELNRRPNSTHIVVPGGELTRLDVDIPRRRKLEVIRAPDGMVQVSASACLALGDPMLDWIRDVSLEGPEFVTRVFLMFVVGPAIEAGEPIWRTHHPVRLISEESEEGCISVSTDYEVPQGLLAGSFAPGTGDELVVGGFPVELMINGRSPDSVNEDQYIWRDSASAKDDEGVFILTLPDLGKRPVKLPNRQGNEQEKSNLFVALKNLEKLLPQLLRALFWGLAAAAPVGLLFWSMQRYRSVDQDSIQRIRSARHGVLALLVFMLAFALQPMLVVGTRVLLDLLPSLPFDSVARTPIDFYVPLSVIVAFLVVSELRAARSGEGRSTYRVRRTFAALGSVVLLGVGFMTLVSVQLVTRPMLINELLTLLPEGWTTLELTILESPIVALVGVFVGSWLSLCLLGFWIPIYWLFRVAVPNGTVVGATLASALIILMLPIVSAFDYLRDIGSFSSLSNLAMHLSYGFSNIIETLVLPAFADFPGRKASLATIVALVVIATVVLRAFREITVELLSQTHKKRFRAYTRTPYLVGLALVIMWPLFNAMDAEIDLISTTTVRLMSVFQAYGVLLALLGPLAIAQEFHRISANYPMADRFEISKEIRVLATAAFAGYLILWNREPTSVFIVIVAGWFVFKHLVLSSQASLDRTDAPDDLARRFVSFLSESNLSKARMEAFRKKFAAGELSEEVLISERVDFASKESNLQQKLGLKSNEAKRLLFRFGPCNSPWNNGIRGALAGLIVAAVLQLLIPFDLSVIPDSSHTGWLALFKNIIVDPEYRVVTKGVEESHLLVLFNEVLNATSIWVVAGFLFGYMFHVVRGDDGFVKAVIFGAGIIIPYFLSQILVAGGENISVVSLTRVAPLLLFLVGLGVVVFDGSVLREQGVDLSKLPAIYGLRTSIGYLSFASGLAAIQPLFELLGWLAKGSN